MVLTSRSWALATAATVLATGVATAQLQFIAPPLLPAGKAQISGVVLTDTGAPAPGAKVIVNTLCRAFEECYSPRETRTDSAGKFVLAGVPSQPLTLQADMPGFSPASFGEAGPGLPGTPIQLDPEDNIIFYTDGVVDVKDGEKKSWGERRFLKSLSKEIFENQETATALGGVVRTIGDFRKETPLDDDVTLILCKYVGAA
jgi:hypothetical protein